MRSSSILKKYDLVQWSLTIYSVLRETTLGGSGDGFTVEHLTRRVLQELGDDVPEPSKPTIERTRRCLASMAGLNIYGQHVDVRASAEVGNTRRMAALWSLR